MGIAQPMGLYRVISKPNDGPNSDFVDAAKCIGQQPFEADRFLSPHLRLQFGIGPEALELEQTTHFQSIDPTWTYRRKMYIVS